MVHLALTRTTRCNHHADYFDEVCSFYVPGGYLWLCCVFSEQVWAYGLAQSLQQEVIADDIHVTLVFPPDTDTPGFEEGKQIHYSEAFVYYFLKIH